jgi:tetratricopeptide (TPR) repeat protein
MTCQRPILFIFVLFNILILSPQVNAFDIERLEKIEKKLEGSKRDYYMAKELMRQDAYFAAIPYVAEFILSRSAWPNDFEKVLESLVLKTGPHSLAGLPRESLSSKESPSLSFILGHDLFNKKQYKASHEILSMIPEGHRFKSEALFIQGSSLNIIEEYEPAKVKYKACIELTSSLASKAKHNKLERYYQILNEQCQIHIARIMYKKKNFKQALKQYEKIEKNSYLWPYLLLEKAWAHYYLEEPNRTLGLLVTYRSPLLSSYFLPESEVLIALAYHKLCLWDDSLEVIDQYYNVYKERSDELKKIIIPHKSSDTYFLKMMLAPIKKIEGYNPFIRNLLTQIRKRVKYSVDLVNFKKSREELNKWLSIKKHTNLTKKMTRQVNHQVGWRTKQLNHYVKKQIFTFINEIHRFSYEMFNIRLEALSSKRNEVYKSKLSDGSTKRTRGSVKNITRSSDEHFYTFTGEFWADELGDYAFGLKSQCQRKETNAFSYQGGNK